MSLLFNVHVAVTLAMSGADVGQDSFPVTIEDSENEEEEGGDEDENEGGENKPAKKIFIGSLIATISLRSQEGGDLGHQLDEPLRISFSTSKVRTCKASFPFIRP